MEVLGDRDAAARSLERSETDDERSTAVAEFVRAARATALSETPRRSNWLGMAGGGKRTGIMDPVRPVFAERMHWQRTIAPRASEIWPPESDELRPDALPVAHPVVADGRLFVKSAGRCIAVDVASFELLWVTQPGAAGIAERSARRGGRSAATTRVLLTDYVTGSLSAGGGP